MIEINYNEYKETIADNMKLIQENHKLKEIIKEVRKYIKDNFSNLDGSIWHEDMKKIFEILDKVDKENI